MTTRPVAVAARIEPEDRARANFYAVLSALYADAPDARLLKSVGESERLPTGDEPLPLAIAWNRLADACLAMDPEAARQEYWDLFVGAGKSEVNLHASHWLSGFMMERPLVGLREDLGRLGLGRKADTSQVEDHLAAVCETMRLLVEGGGGRPPAEVAEQAAFFRDHVDSWVPALCAALAQTPLANFYRTVGEFTDTFVAIERDAFAID
ncbi:MAG TPA: molecular chaperone TorD family protein [Casimicrobiaceae bacterium]|nr:molecular chaperone TorD family protein [Casimicrobiaceae bacterium]